MGLKMISPIDGGFLLIERRSVPVHVSALFEFTKPADAGPDFVPALKEAMRGSHQLAPPWNLRPVRLLSRLPLMRDVDELDIDHHVKLHTLPAPGGERELAELVAELHPPQLSMRHPLWQIHLIDGFDGNRFAVQFKGHHAIFDGTTFMRRIVGWLSTDPDERGKPPLFTVGPPGQTKVAAEAKGPGLLSVIGELRRAKKDADHGEYDGLPLAAAYRKPHGLFTGKIDSGRRFSVRQYDLAELKTLAKAGGVTVNELLMWLTSSALRTYLAEQHKLPDEPLNTAVAVNLRAADDDRPGSAFGTMVASLATNVADPLERLRAIKQSSAAGKAHLKSLTPQAQSLQSLVVMGKMMAALILGFGGRTPQPFSLAMSNVPGPPVPMYLEGARMDLFAPVHILWHNSPLNVTCISHAGRLTVGITGATKTVQSMQRIGTAMDEALAELRGRLAPTREVES